MMSKVLFIMLDGCRPDALAQAQTPHLDSLWKTGAYTWKARSVMPSVTLPAHTSMFRGVPPQKHGIGADNTFRTSAASFPSVFELSAEAGRHNAMFYSWEQLRDLSRPGSLKMSYCLSAEAHLGGDNDTPVALAAGAYLVNTQPDFCFLYLGDIDITGHLHGWMSPEYIEAIEMNDRAIGRVLAMLQEAHLREKYTILIQADHGGHGTDHGTDSPEDMTIPWIINGTGVKSGHMIQSPVGLCDTPATIAHVLGLQRPDVWEGQPVYEAFLD
jgi:predicted AlkP superfamily pyrophosphatase or phosphodiesterase